MRRFLLLNAVAVSLGLASFAAGGVQSEPRKLRVPGESVTGPEPSLSGRGDGRVPVEVSLMVPAAPRSAQPPPVEPGQIGFAVPVAAPWNLGVDLGALAWSPARGGQAAAVVFESRGAGGLRIGIGVNSVPTATRLRFFSPAAGAFVGSELRVADLVHRQRRALAADRGSGVRMARQEPGRFWSPTVAGERIGVEIWVPTGVSIAGQRLDLPLLSHLTNSPWERARAEVAAGRMCQMDVVCDPDWLEAAKSVAKIAYTRNGGTFTCTGQLLADTDGTSAIDYLSTANHCLDSQALADTAEFFWFFQSVECGGQAPQQVVSTTGGATLLATRDVNSSTDFSLLLLEQAAPAGTTRTGWSTEEPKKEQPAIGLHHPGGDIKKVSEGLTKLLAPAAGQDFDSRIWVRWDRGVTEDGSSGSGLWLDGSWPDQPFIGVLSSGSSACSNQDGIDHYGRFDLSYAALEPWLDPSALVSIASGAEHRGAVEPGQWQIYRIEPPSRRAAGGAVDALLRDLVGNPDLYVLGGLAPTLSLFDCRSQNAAGQQERCSAATASGTVFVGAFGAGATRAEYTLVADVTPGPTKPPKKPKKVRVSKVAEGQLEITWKDRAGDETGYTLERRIGNGDWVELATLPADTTSTVDSGLEPKVKTCYRLRAFNEVGASASTGKRCGKP